MKRRKLSLKSLMTARRSILAKGISNRYPKKGLLSRVVTNVLAAIYSNTWLQEYVYEPLELPAGNATYVGELDPIQNQIACQLFSFRRQLGEKVTQLPHALTPAEIEEYEVLSMEYITSIHNVQMALQIQLGVDFPEFKDRIHYLEITQGWEVYYTPSTDLILIMPE